MSDADVFAPIRHLNMDLENSLVAVFCYDLGQMMTRESTVDLPGRVTF